MGPRAALLGAYALGSYFPFYVLLSNLHSEPLAILIGHGNIIPGLEQALEGREAGERFSVQVAAKDAYGERREGLTQRVSRKLFKEKKLAAGDQVVLQTQHGPRAVTVQKVGMSVVDIDLNHPMAGRNLDFDIEVIDVREGTDEERAHGHVHGEGGHQH